MKIAVMGKGGSGKTTISGVLARVLAQSGHKVLAVDADTNPNLGISLGLGADVTFDLVAARQALDDEPDNKDNHAATMEEVIDKFGADAPDGIRFVQVTKVDAPSSGCAWCGLSPEQLLRELERKTKRMVIADFEAGVGTMSRTDAKVLDLAIVVVEPYMKSIETARRLLEMVEDTKSKRRVILVANKVTGEDDLVFLKEKLGGRSPDVVIPQDRNVAEADLTAKSPVDRDPNSPAVEAIRGLAATVAA